MSKDRINDSDILSSQMAASESKGKAKEQKEY